MPWRFLVILLIALLTLQTDGAKRRRFRKRVYGGKVSSIYEFPYVVSLEIHKRYRCGGTIVSKRHIITAAHCILDRNQTQIYGIKVNTSFSEDHSSKPIAISRISVYPGYKTRSTGDSPNDIAVLTLSEDLQFGKGVQPALLPKPGAELPNNTEVSVAGWGSVNLSTIPSKVLQSVRLPIINLNLCKAAYKDVKKRVDDNMICAGHIKGGPDACAGDSGGPLVLDQVLYGVTSFGDSKGCSRSMLPGVYTNVASFIDFIKNSMKQ